LRILIVMKAARKGEEVAKRPVTTETVRGRRYLADGAVSDLVQRADRLTAAVEGSEFEPYQVSIRLHDGGVADAHCTCLYD
jgi:uncharacterized Zn finger protein